MISVQEAQARLRAAVQPGSGEWVPLVELPGRVLAADVNSPLDLPPFAQSSMDGYAIGALPFDAADPHAFAWTLIGETRAGDAPAATLEPGQTRRVFTGAALPPGTVAVVRQEVAQTSGVQVQFSTEADLILTRGQVLHAGALSLLASCGLDRAFVYRLPRVSILSSGDELVPPGQPLGPGQIYESNTLALRAAVFALGIPEVRTRHLPDREADIVQALHEELALSDVLLLCGGISVGDYDFSGRALRRLGVEEVFYRVAQKPGMPLFFGRVAVDREAIPPEVLVFGLPGNPASSLVCFWQYARTALRILMGHEEPGLVSEQLPIAAPLRKTAPRAAFERALVKDGLVYPLEGQDSYQLRSLADANALLVLPEGEVEYQVGDLVRVDWL
jgi:molybdopterin molybdotransferase